MKILFVGGKSLGYGILKKLLNEPCEVVGIVSNKSDLSPTWFPSVKPLAEKNQIPYFTEEIPDIEYDWLICAYYDRLIPKAVIDRPGTAINVHMGRIQEYRGCYPTTFPIINGDKWAGVTIHQIVEEIDAGPVYAQTRVSVDPSDTGQTLYYKCVGAGVSLFDESWHMISSRIISPILYNIKKARYYSRSDFPSLEISAKWPEDKQDRYMRALTFPPFPKPYIK